MWQAAKIKAEEQASKRLSNALLSRPLETSGETASQNRTSLSSGSYTLGRQLDTKSLQAQSEGINATTLVQQQLDDVQRRFESSEERRARDMQGLGASLADMEKQLSSVLSIVQAQAVVQKQHLAIVQKLESSSLV